MACLRCALCLRHLRRSFRVQLFGARSRQRSGWVRCPSEDGTASNLWRRDALFWAETLIRFCSDVCGIRYGNRFRTVSQLVPLGAASPFEVEAYLLLALPRSLGGEGFCDIELNVEVMLSTGARAIVGKSRVYIDILLSSPDGGDRWPLNVRERPRTDAQGMACVTLTA